MSSIQVILGHGAVSLAVVGTVPALVYFLSIVFVLLTCVSTLQYLIESWGRHLVSVEPM